MRERIVEQPVAVVRDEAIDRGLVGRNDSERRFEVLASESEPGRAVVRRADDDEERRRGVLEELLEPPGERPAAAAVVDVRDEGRPQRAGGGGVARQAGAVRIGELRAEPLPELAGLGSVTADARWLPDRV